MDPNNPVVQLCLAGMQAEFADDIAAARRLFEQAWGAAGDDYESCLAAHFLARHQPSAEETLRWNQAALDHAGRADPGMVRDFYPSLQLNLGHSWEQLGDQERARRCYALAAAASADLPAGSYGALVRGGVAAGLERTAGHEEELS